jgi:hypothetical protein
MQAGDVNVMNSSLKAAVDQVSCIINCHKQAGDVNIMNSSLKAAVDQVVLVSSIATCRLVMSTL